MFGRDEKVSPVRLTAVQYIILAIFMILAYGLWQLQVMQSDKYASLAEKNRVRNVPILAPRGKILDREGRIIVDNYPSFTALLLRDSSRDLSADEVANETKFLVGPKYSAQLRRGVETPETANGDADLSMMVVADARPFPLGPPAGVCHWPRQSGAVAEE